MKVLVIGSGGREHALVWKIAQSKKVDKIYCASGNGGTTGLAENIPIASNQIDKLLNFAREKKINLTVVGPEEPLILGITDKFRKNDLAIVGPSRRAAQIEGSKIFAKKLMKKYGIPTAKFETFESFETAKKYLSRQSYPVVIKADGTCFGKGVAVCDSEDEAQNFLRLLMKEKERGRAGEKVVIEECLTGQELSFMVATDGVDFVSLLPSQDHKRIFDNDQGPNTGGMGAYAPVPFVNSSMIGIIELSIVAPTISAMKKEGRPYKGILYPGIILTRDGPKVLEFNCRFGDPEIQPVLTLLKTDIIDIFLGIIKNNIKQLKVKWNKGCAVNVVLASKDYPNNYEKGKIIEGLEKLNGRENFHIFHAASKQLNGQLVSSGGRVLGVTGLGSNLKSAIRNTYKYIGKGRIYFSGMHYRHDIGQKGLMKKLWQ